MGDRVIGLCNFCEVHGPRVVFVCQETSGVNGQKRVGAKEFYGDVILDLGTYSSDNVSATTSSDSCDGCRAFSSSKPVHLTNDHRKRLSYIGCQYPYRADVLSRVRCACVRSLSCEACPDRQGPILFGDAAGGYCLCYVFTLKDSKARGFQHSYSIVIVSHRMEELIRNYSSLVASLKGVVTTLKSWSDRVFDREGTESNDRLPQIAASGRAGWVPSGFFLRGGGGGRQLMAFPRSLTELTDRQDVFRILHELFVCIHQVAASNETYGLRSRDCSSWLAQRSDSPTFENDDENDTNSDVKNGDCCHICASWPKDPSSPYSAFRTLRLLYHALGSEAFSILAYHLLIGNQVVVRSSCIYSNRMFLDALKLLLPSGCIKCVDSSWDYREPWECNLVGLVIHSRTSELVQNRDEGDSGYATTNFIGGLSQSAADGCIILCVEMPSVNSIEKRNGKIDYSDNLPSNSITNDRCKCLPWERYSFRMFCNAAAASNGYADVGSPSLLHSLLNLFSTTFSKFYASDQGAVAGMCALEALKDEWLNKAKLYYVMSKTSNDGEGDRWRTTFFRISKCSPMDEPVLKFWKGGLSRRFKQSILSHYALTQRQRH